MKELLNSPKMKERLDALKNLMDMHRSGVLEEVKPGSDVNSHIHTFYSFSPYSPSAAVYNSYLSGLATTGIMDHDSISGAREFIEAGEIVGIPITVGAELRASFVGTFLEDRRINNPDQNTVAYVALHGIPHSSIDALSEFFKPISKAREIRNRLMVEKINEILSDSNVFITYDDDVLPISMANEGGSVTERHLLFAVAGKLIEKFGKGATLVNFLNVKLGIALSGKNLSYLSDDKNPNYRYDLLNVLKGNMVEKFYIPATDEALPISEVADFADRNGVILAYAYLGDVTDSVTGDKKAQKFEDEYIDELFPLLKSLNFKAITYMPSRNSSEQLTKLRNLCEKYKMFQISGEDINQPRQKFVCEAMRTPEFSNLVDSAWALIGHELAATESLKNGMFSYEIEQKMPLLNDRCNFFKDIALKKFH